MAKISYKFKKELEVARDLKKLKKLIPKMKSENSLIVETKRLTNELHKVIMDTDQYYGLNWLVGFEKYIQLKKGKYSLSKRHFSRGHIVSVELFGHFNKELTFVHPAIVLYDDNSSNMLIAPISSSKFNDNNPLHVDILISDGMKNNCGICLDQIRFIDKSRFVFQWKDHHHSYIKVSSEILDLIDSTLLAHYLPSSNGLINQLKENLEKEKEENKKLNEQIRQLTSQSSSI